MPNDDIATSARALAQRRATGAPLGDWKLAETVLALLIAVWGDPSKLGGTRKRADGSNSQDPVVKLIAQINGRTEDAVVLKVMNLRWVLTGGRHGMPAASRADREVVQRFTGHFDELLAAATAIEGELPDARGIVDALVPRAIAAGSPSPAGLAASEGGLPPTTGVLAQVMQRRGQNVFRARVLANFEYGCGFCGLQSRMPEDNSYLLIASHIHPWAEATDHQRVDPSNGLSLCAIHDRAFEWGFLTVDDSLHIVASQHASEHYAPDARVRAEILDLGGQPLRHPESNFLAPGREYLEYHRSRIFELRFRKGA